jgi:predicted Zn-dependent protease
VHTAVSSARLNKVATAQASRRGIEILLGSGLGQEMELEADLVGARLMELAGYVAPTPHEHSPSLRQNHAAAARSGPTTVSSNRGSGRNTASPMIYVGGNF